MNTDDLETVWHGSLWRERESPKPAPPLRAPRETVQTLRARQKQGWILDHLRDQPMTLAQLTQTGQFGTVWAIRVLVKRLIASGSIQVVGKRYGHEGPPAAVYGVRR